tara:strand:- start:12451 stop:13458 length:1008 start_codon:yes stop_codon:yes gene_type:complete
MANELLISQTGALSWSQEDVQKYFLEPLFVSNNSLEWMDVMTDVSGTSIKLDRYSALKDVTKAQSLAGFAYDDTESSNTNITLTLSRLEVEHRQAAFTMFNHIKSQLMKKGIARNNLDGTLIKQIVSELLMGGIARDFSTILWWGDTTNGTGTQKLANGFWHAIDTANLPAGQKTVYATSAIDSLKAMTAAQTNELAMMDRVIFTSRAFSDKYAGELMSAGSHVAAYDALQKGVPNLSFHGIPIVTLPEWDADITNHGTALGSMANGNAPNGTTAVDKNCAIMTARGNLTVATDFKANPVDMWYNRDEKENRFRMNYSFGCNIKEEALCVTMVND